MFSGEYSGEIVGLCLDMCPEKEMIFREREKLLHPFEILLKTEDDRNPKSDINKTVKCYASEDNKLIKADINKTVKCYTRSAAGKDLLDPDALRPPRILLSTIDYLFNKVFLSDEYEWNYVYDFINDRLKAVRQDMVVQNLPKASSVAIMQPIVRFYAYSAYRLCDVPAQKYDAKLNASELQECLKKILYLYDEFDVLEDIMENCRHDYSNALYVQARPEIEAMYLVFNLGETSSINRALKLPKKWKCPLVSKAISLSLCIRRGNWVRACKNMKTLPMMLKCVVLLKMPNIRRDALKAMSVAYFSKNSRYPLCKLQHFLYYSALDDVKSDFKFYNLKYDDTDFANFTTKAFDAPKILNKTFQDEEVNATLEKWNVPFMLLNGSPRNKCTDYYSSESQRTITFV